jgi:hypothetical protein
VVLLGWVNTAIILKKTIFNQSLISMPTLFLLYKSIKAALIYSLQQALIMNMVEIAFNFFRFHPIPREPNA